MITVLAGGVGAARFLRGLVRAVPPAEVTAVVNVADDIELYGLRICPDLDSITYWLGGGIDPERQWGRDDERYTVASELGRYGQEPWFTLGDRDLATHLHRTGELARGRPLSAVTAGIAGAWGVEARVLPATDDRIETRIHTADGRDLHFQEYWVAERAEPEVARIEVAGSADARPAPGVVEAITGAEVVLIAPSNPVVSIGTILAVPGIRDAVKSGPAPVVGISPLIGGRVVRGMADRLLPAVGAEVSVAGVARLYADLLDAWVVDHADAHHAEGIRQELGIPVAATETLMDDPEVAAALARTALDLAVSA